MPTLQANGLRIAYEEFGEPQATPLLLIMGLGAQMILWREAFCRALAARGYRVIRFDNRDIGESTWLDELGEPNLLSVMSAALTQQPISAPYLLRDMAADAVGLLDGLGIERAHIVGASMGGMIAQTLAIEYPQRVRSLTSIMSTTGNPALPPPNPAATAVLMTPPPTNRAAAIEHGVHVYRSIGSPGFPFDEAEVRELAARSYDRGFHPQGILRQLVAIAASGSRVDALRALDVPALVVHGSEDPLVNIAGGRETAACIRGAELLVIDGMGHDMPRPMWAQLIDAICRLAEAADAPAATGTARASG